MPTLHIHGLRGSLLLRGERGDPSGHLAEAERDDNTRGKNPVRDGKEAGMSMEVENEEDVWEEYWEAYDHADDIEQEEYWEEL